jgi:peptidoglycan hydrolase FlgJ
MADFKIPIAQSPATAAANTYTDLKGLAAIKKDPNSPQAIHALAQQVDALFLQMMLKSMREAGAEEGEPDSNAMGMYQDLYDKQISLTLSQHGGLGIGALLTRQLGHAAAAAKEAAAPAAAAKKAAAPASTAPQPTPAAAVPPLGDTGSRPHAGAVTAQSASDFVKAVLPTIRAAATTLGVSPLGMLAQAALETGWGHRMARAADGAPSLNLFGVKADPSWKGARATANTVEFSAGVATQRQAAFRVYGSIADSVSDFASLLSGSPRYARAIAQGGTAQAYIESIGQSGYATDPEYAAKLHDILHGSTLRTALSGTLAL